MAVPPTDLPGKGLVAWLTRIRDQEMPVFGRTVNAVRAVTDNEASSASQLAQVVLQDAALTAKVLRLANSAHFNPGRQPISTVSRAIVVLGFGLVGDLVLSAALIDALLSGGLRSRVAAEMARCFHAAVQARTAALHRCEAQAEEVFIAALLGRVGEMAFWCFGGPQARTLDQALQDDPYSRPEDLQQRVLGFRLRALSVALAREWRLGPLVSAVAEPPLRPDACEQAVVLGHQLAQAVELGWDQPAAAAVVGRFAAFVGVEPVQLQPQLVANAVEAAEVATQFGAQEAARLIPVPAAQRPDGDASVAASPDPLLQLRILRDLSLLLTSRPRVHDVLQLVLEGIYRGLAMDSALFALLSPDRQQLAARAALGPGAERLLREFVFAVDGRDESIPGRLLAQCEPLWLSATAPGCAQVERLRRVSGQREVLLAPIAANGRAVGLFCATRDAAHPADVEVWQGFLHFVQQASLSFEHVAAAGARRG